MAEKFDEVNNVELDDIDAQRGTKLGLTGKQIKIAQILADPSETRTITKICEAEGVPRRTFYNWYGRSEFVNFVNELVEKYTDAELSKVWGSLSRKAASGDVQALKLFFEMKGKYREVKEIKHSGFTLESMLESFNNGNSDKTE